MFSSRLVIPKTFSLGIKCPINCLSQRVFQMHPISTSCSCHSEFESGRQARMLKKLMTGSNRSRKKFFSVEQPVSKTFAEFGLLKKGGSTQRSAPPSGRVLQRLDVLNTLFIEQITSLLATGEVSPEFLGLGIQISKVKVKSDFSAVNVYWYASGTEKDEIINQLLTRTAGHLRHELSQLRVIGIVPPIQFFRDRTFSKFQEVETLLNKIDLGPDFEPTPASKSFYIQQPNADLEKNVVNRDVKSYSQDEQKGLMEKDDNDSNMMRQDMLGVKHDFIMKEITKAVQAKKDRIAAKARQQVQPISSISDEYYASGPQQPIGDVNKSTPGDEETGGATPSVENHLARQREFLKYLKKRQAEKAKELRRLSTEQMDRDFVLSQADERWKRSLEERIRMLDDNANNAHDEEDDYAYEEEYYRNLRQGFEEDSYK